MRAVLLDIEGTTTSISFVYDVLFPYAEARLEAYCSGADASDAAITLLRREYQEEIAKDASLPDFGNGAPYALHLMRQDRKSTGLKALQGRIWKEGYASGEIRAHLFPDVPDALVAWRKTGLRLRIFSSGSVEAQHLLFGHTEAGDLVPLFEGFHDTTTGPKQEAESYRKIALAFALPPGEILFLSDVRAELDAAAEAGMRTGLMRRPGNRPVDPGPHPVFSSFAGIPGLT